MSTELGIGIFLTALVVFILRIYNVYRVRPRRLWLKYMVYFQQTKEDQSVELSSAINATVGEIGYSKFLGLPESSRGFHLWVNLAIGVRALRVSIAEPTGLSNLPPLLIPWDRIECARETDNEWGKPGFGFQIRDMPPELDSNHGGNFLIWLNAPKEELQLLVEAVGNAGFHSKGES